MGSVIAHCPAATVPVHELTPSLTVTLPAGVPPADVTLKFTVTTWPTTDGSGLSDVIVLVVAMRLTWWVTIADAGLALWLSSPA